MRILIVEDDRRLAALLAPELGYEGYLVDIAHDGESGLALALSGVHAMAVVDWMLPKRDGPSMIRALRAAGIAMPILLLTSRSQLDDRIHGLDAGADDYLAKPFAFKELLARLRALRRRLNHTSVSDELRCGEIVLDLRSHKARGKDAPMDLTSTEWNLLEYMIRNSGRALTRRQILDQVWSFDADVQETMVDVYVSYLRRKLKAAGLDPVTTVRGVGYRMECSAA